MKIKKGDNIIVIAGSNKGKKGKVLKAIPAENKVIVEGINMRKKSMKGPAKGGKGGIIELAMPIHVSNVAKEDK
jgi:large subunit ribosomal protein L24